MQTAQFRRARGLWALAVVVLIAGWGFTSALAADVVKDRGVLEENPASGVSIRLPAKAPADAPVGLAPLDSCPKVVLPNNGGTSSNERAPNPYWQYGRAVYLITAAELAANGLPNGSSPTGIGWTYSTAPAAAATSTTFKVYLQNTTDTTNNASTTWATAISTMTLVHNGNITIPANTPQWDIAFSGGSPFTYTGGGLYVAFDWQWAGPDETCVVLCTTTLTNGLKGGQSDTAPPTTIGASSYRPETRLTVTTTTADVSVDYVITLGSLPQPLVGPQTVKAVITNKGIAQSNISVSLNIAGVQPFTDTQVIPALAACNGQTTVSFAPFTPSAIGSNTVTVSVPADSNPANDSKSLPLDETYTLYSYKHPGTTAAGGVGVNGYTAAFVAKFTTTAAAKVSAVNLEFPATSATTYRVAIYPDSATTPGTPGLTPLYVDAADRTVTVAGPVTITLPSPVPVGPGTFYAGIHQTNTTNAGLSYDAETPIRSGAFFLAVPLPLTAWGDFSPLNNFKLNIGVTLTQCAVDADCNDNNVCTADSCQNQLCSHTPLTGPCETGNPCTNPGACTNGVCVSGPNPCNDNNACTNDICHVGGSCTFEPVNCDDGNPCTDDFCDTVTGCYHTNNTAPCSDGNPCTYPDVCAGGACTPGPPVAITPVQFCNQAAITIPTSGTATPYPAPITVSGRGSYLCKVTVNINGFSHTYPSDVATLLSGPAPASKNASIMTNVGGSTAATNVNLTLDDAAAAPIPTPIVSGTYKPTGVSVSWPAPAPAALGGAALSVFNGTDPNGEWDLWVWDQYTPDSGSIASWCVNIYTACSVAADCNDNNVCTDDTCVDGQCIHTNTVSCNDNNACTADSCDPASGQCVYTPIVCNDNNPCTDNLCDPQSGCYYPPDDNLPCTDNSLCTADACVNGACVGTPVVFCDQGPLCNAGACDPATGQCVYTPNPGAACDDGNVCTTNDVCSCGTGGLSENFDNAVVPALPNGWTDSPVGAWATENTVSQTAPNAAFSNEPATVSDKSLVSPTFIAGVGGGQVTFQHQYAFEGSSICWDGGVLEIAINGGAWQDIIAAGGAFVTGGYNGTVYTGYSNPLQGRPAWCLNTAGAWIPVTVSLPAAAGGQSVQLRWRLGSDSAVSATGWYIDTIDIPVCNIACVGTPKTCTALDQCHEPGTCDQQTGACSNPPKPDGSACDDNNVCTTPDFCTNGVCGGQQVPPPPEVNNSVRVLGGGGGAGGTITWADAPGLYNVYRGARTAGWLYDHACFDPNTPGPTVDPNAPSAGEAYYYLVSRKDACGESILGRDWLGAPAPNASPCP